MRAVFNDWLWGSPVRSLFLDGTEPYLRVSNLGNVDERKYPLGRVPTHPLRELGVAALGKTMGDESVYKYHGWTAI